MTDPWWEDDGVTVFHGDCIEVMRGLPAGSVDAIVTDPPYELGFMGKTWDASGIAYRLDLWREALRVLKPGGHLLAFGGTRTWHRLGVAIEDAGFEIRDSIAWMYGSGFPKSLDVSKAIDKRGGAVAGFAEFRDAVKAAMKQNGVSRAHLQAALGNFMLSHYLTAGSQPAIPNWRDYQIIRDSVGLGDKYDKVFIPEAEREVLGERTVPLGPGFAGPTHRNDCGVVDYKDTAPATPAAQQWQGWGTALKPAHEPIVVARKPLDGTVAENVLRWDTGALNIDGSRIGTDGGRWPANVILDESQAAELDRQSGDTVGASRFFYVAKADAAERPRDGDTAHPTVKPVDLMRYLVRLVTPPGGIVLDPFAGSGTTAQACIIEGFTVITIEKDETYLPLIRQRLTQPQALALPM